MKTWFLRSVALLALAVLGACGGGGGGGGGFFPITGVPGAATGALSGNVTCDSVPNTTRGASWGVRDHETLVPAERGAACPGRARSVRRRGRRRWRLLPDHGRAGRDHSDVERQRDF